jgi:ATP-binding cassette subfamily F protein 3
MSSIILKDIQLSYGERDLFNKISVDFQQDQKIGIAGRNGAGKSTLLRVIAGLQPLDSGTVSISKQMKIAFLPQEVILNSEKTIFDEAFTIFEQYTQLEQEQRTIEEKLESGHEDAADLLERYQYILDALAHFNRTEAEKQTVNLLQGLGFSKEKFDTSVNTLSVGWKMRLVLAKLLLQQADFYLFDEPTNHLDIVTKEWFLDFLRESPFGYLLVTHDRYFLDKACDWIFELSRGNGSLYHGNYTAYLKQYEQQQADLKSAYHLQQKDIARKKETIERFRASASKARMAQSMIKQLEKIELIEVEPPEPTISFSFPELERAGRVVLTINNLAYSYGDKQLFKNVSCEIQRGQKVALVARNGMGKSTLFDLIVGKLALQTGTVTFGHNVHTAFFEQDQTKALHQNKTVLEELEYSCPKVSEQRLRAFLGSFLFVGDDVYKKISMLSGGERNRVAMVKVLLQNANFLILDEPTNHLDLYAKSVLLQALQQYTGTMFFVSHDHQFIQELATDIAELTPNGLFYYPGTYEAYLAEKKSKETFVDERKVERKEKEKNEPQKVQTKESQKNLRELEQRIQKLEKKIAEATKKLTADTHDYDASKKIIDAIAVMQAELESALREWEKSA